MGRKSKIEAHPDWRIIVKRLAAGEEYSNIVQDFPGLTWFDLDYYAKNKLPELLSKSEDLKAEIEGERGNDTYSEVLKLKDQAVDILAEAQGAGDLKTALMGIREARGCLELMFKAEGRIAAQPMINILVLPEWLALKDRIVVALRPYPEALRAVRDALR
jgi:hypothetical protein